MRPRKFQFIFKGFLNNVLLRHWLDSQNSCLLDILKMALQVVLAVLWKHF